MKLFIAFLILIPCLLTAQNQPDTKNMADYDMRFATWNFTKEQVKTSEPGELVEEGDQYLVFYDTIAGRAVNVLYEFTGGRFQNGMFIFDGDYVNPDQYIADYDTVRDWLVSVYGETDVEDVLGDNGDYGHEREHLGKGVVEGEVIFTAMWELDDTYVDLTLASEEGVVYLIVRFEYYPTEVPGE